MNNRSGKPEDKNPEIASAEGRVKAQGTLCLFRSATAKALIWSKGTFRPGPPFPS